jgi:hypothetical protein
VIDEDSWGNVDDLLLAIAAMGDRHPMTTIYRFLGLVRDPAANADELNILVTPESLPHWGDFSSIQPVIDSVKDPGFGTRILRYPHAKDVGYFRILEGVPESFDRRVPASEDVPIIIVVVWRPEYDRWLIHGFGMLEPEELEHVRTGRDDPPDF